MIFSGIKPVFPPQMLDELIFVPEVVWTYLWQINFFFPEILKVPLGTGLLKSKKKNYGWRRKKCAPHGSCGEPQFMNCSWIIQLVHELFMNMFKLLLRIFGYFQTLEHLLNMFMNSSWTCSKKENNLDWRPWKLFWRWVRPRIRPHKGFLPQLEEFYFTTSEKKIWKIQKSTLAFWV